MLVNSLKKNNYSSSLKNTTNNISKTIYSGVLVLREAIKAIVTRTLFSFESHKTFAQELTTKSSQKEKISWTYSKKFLITAKVIGALAIYFLVTSEYMKNYLNKSFPRNDGFQAKPVNKVAEKLKLEMAKILECVQKKKSGSEQFDILNNVFICGGYKKQYLDCNDLNRNGELSKSFRYLKKMLHPDHQPKDKKEEGKQAIIKVTDEFDLMKKECNSRNLRAIGNDFAQHFKDFDQYFKNEDFDMWFEEFMKEF